MSSALAKLCLPNNRDSVQRGGRVEIIANDQGHRITPSWVSFTDDERLVGDSAKNAFHSNPSNTVFDAKRLIGRKMDEADIKKDMKHWPFGVVDRGGKPSISVGFKGEKREFVSPVLGLLLAPCSQITLAIDTGRN